MIDFRSKSERDAEQRQRGKEDSDYRQMYETVLAENRELNGKFAALEGRFGEVLEKFLALETRLAEHERQASERGQELLTMSETMQEMVAAGYKQQTDLMERFRADISERLTKAEATTLQIEKDG